MIFSSFIGTNSFIKILLHVANSTDSPSVI